MKVFVYLDFLPRRTGSGAHLRFYSNAQALLDLGFEVEFVEVSPKVSPYELPEEFSECRVRHVPVGVDRVGMMGRIAFRLGVPTAGSMRYAFSPHKSMLEVSRELIIRFPNALHFVEGEQLGSAIPFLTTRRVVWSCHDLLSSVHLAIARVASELEGRAMSVPERRGIRFSTNAERRVARASPLILTISEGDRQRLRDWGYTQVETLPMSIPNTDLLEKRRTRSTRDGFLTLLHLGAISHLPSYDSLKFLLAEVFPILHNRVRERLRLKVVGRITPEDPRCRQILDLANCFPGQVEIAGFVEDLDPIFEKCDLQIVASFEESGLRTRIIESFAQGLPVVCTPAAAVGVLGARANRNILVANSAQDFASVLTAILDDPIQLDDVAYEARKTYDATYSRGVVANTLGKYLRHYMNVFSDQTSPV